MGIKLINVIFSEQNSKIFYIYFPEKNSPPQNNVNEDSIKLVNHFLSKYKSLKDKASENEENAIKQLMFSHKKLEEAQDDYIKFLKEHQQ